MVVNLKGSAKQPQVSPLRAILQALGQGCQGFYCQGKKPPLTLTFPYQPDTLQDEASAKPVILLKSRKAKIKPAGILPIFRGFNFEPDICRCSVSEAGLMKSAKGRSFTEVSRY